MSNRLANSIWNWIPLLGTLLIVKVTVAVIFGYRNYFPPNFESDFLRGREIYFFHDYQWAFYPHLVSGPLSIGLGLLLLSTRFRARYPRWHRFWGRIQVANVLLIVAPSGLWMAFYASPGIIAVWSFAILAILTGFTAFMGWRDAVGRQFANHRLWMTRCLILLCSAIAIRVLGGAATVLEMEGEWVNPTLSWVSWVIPSLCFEVNLLLLQRRKTKKSIPFPKTHDQTGGS